MEKVKRCCRDMPLRRSIVLCMACFLALVIALSAAELAFCDAARERVLRTSVQALGERYYLTTEDGRRLGEGTVISREPGLLTQKQERALALIRAVEFLALPVNTALGMMGTALLFYRVKLKEPLRLMTQAAQKIADNDLDFSLVYPSEDEMGRLCTALETMRAALKEGHTAVWRQMEERKRLNAAFAHDLRTPLTVLRGYSEMLFAHGDPQVRRTAETMQRHTVRLTHYAQSMSSLQRLEEVRPDMRPVVLGALAEELRAEAEMICRQAEKTLEFDVSGDEELFLDREFVFEIFGNLMSNASRYAASRIGVNVDRKGDELRITVSDDGPGFTAEGLARAGEPYYTRAARTEEHFGLGLYIGRLLCARHGGGLIIENDARGGARVEARLFAKAPAQ